MHLGDVVVGGEVVVRLGDQGEDVFGTEAGRELQQQFEVEGVLEVLQDLEVLLVDEG